MRIINHLIGDQLKAKYSNTKFYIKEGLILLFKSSIVFSSVITFFFIVFWILTPDPMQKRMYPQFEVKKMNPTNMITLYANNLQKQLFCPNRTSQYHGKFYTKQQYCQVEHTPFPFQITNLHQIDVFLSGMNKNVQYITGCIVKIHQTRAVCQKFAYSKQIQIFNNLILENLYSIEIELTLRKENQYFGQIEILFKQENPFILRLLKEYYFFVSTTASYSMAALLTISFIVFQIPDILQKSPKQIVKKSKVQ